MSSMELVCSCCGDTFILLINHQIPPIDKNIVCCVDCAQAVNSYVRTMADKITGNRKHQTSKYAVEMIYYSYLNQITITNLDTTLDDYIIDKDVIDDNLIMSLKQITRLLGIRSIGDTIIHNSQYIAITDIIRSELCITIYLQTRKISSLYDKCINMINYTSQLDILPEHIFGHIVDKNPILYLTKMFM
ncbi:hypothetical protein E24_00267 [Faustovirus]|nr:hypothetical protein PRJ_Fausto_00252 [Faustovirus]AMN83191.1 hypothetical protein E24_00267 [Faustovirus]AMN84172.1 hypothetical protein D5a_00266 [Faustovirus]AMN85161.1 hypothetical protein E23_00266 [Faustovirus]QBR99160.1 hypothetical protein [Faustovirus mariensis]